MEIYWKESDYNKSMLPLWYLRKKYYGIGTDDKMCYFYTLNGTTVLGAVIYNLMDIYHLNNI